MWPGGVHSHTASIVDSVWSPTLRRRVGLTLFVVMFAGACAGASPEVPLGPDGRVDPVLVLGREVYGAQCSTCHGVSGGGGSGVRLAGTVVGSIPDADDQAAVILDGRGRMPAFRNRLSAEQIEAVVRYTREVLG
jgi:mono/diheme cytochrome c family protein